MASLRQCPDWLELLERDERVVLSLRPDPETEHVAFDGPRVLQSLGRIFADPGGKERPRRRGNLLGG
jgi:hypothetical protein